VNSASAGRRFTSIWLAEFGPVNTTGRPHSDVSAYSARVTKSNMRRSKIASRCASSASLCTSLPS
jgi:hypothetical protein